MDAAYALEHHLHGPVGHPHAVDHATRDAHGEDALELELVLVVGKRVGRPRVEARDEHVLARVVLDHADAAGAVELDRHNVVGEDDVA